MEPFADRYAELRDSIALKAGATTSEAEAYLNLGRMPITREAELKFQNSLTKFSPEERRFIQENHIIANSLNNLQAPLAPVILQGPEEALQSATKPESLDISNLDKARVEKEIAILTEQARASGKPENVIEKMIEGRVRKFYEEVVLLEQSFVINPDKKVSEVVSDLGKEIGCTLKLSGYLRFGF